MLCRQRQQGVLQGARDTDIIRDELAKVRATRREGSFGTHKEHYGLKRIKARTKLTEILNIFFVIHTEDVVLLVRREGSETKLNRGKFMDGLPVDS